MKEINFFIKLTKEKKLRLVEPSEELKKSYLEKSESNMVSAKILLKNSRLEEAVSLTYYSMYNLLMALFFKSRIKSENHLATTSLLEKIFGLDNSFVIFAKKERVDKQYYVDFKITKKDVEILIQKAEDFNLNLFDFISKLTNEKIKNYRDKFINLINFN
ncbi:MAG: HEPN domain-containing protein [Nanoarchaeota archaeon]|nr:HEPN domain-containing protein [Nanoarchaeota archaeon]MBU1027595.1 HEPN domain-containing protein [Nanoarchaeota archaeon]